MDLTALTYIVVIVDEMADLMMVAGKEIRPDPTAGADGARGGHRYHHGDAAAVVDVITGTIKPTPDPHFLPGHVEDRQPDHLGEMGAEQLLGQGDMLYMAGGGRISRCTGLSSPTPKSKRVADLKMPGQPEYPTR